MRPRSPSNPPGLQNDSEEVTPSSRRTVVLQVLSGSVIALLAAVAAHTLGVQQLLRVPDRALYLPAAIVGALIGATRLRPLIWIAAAPVAVIALIVAYTPIVAAIGAPLVRKDPLPGRVDAIAVLSQGLTPEGRMRSGTLDRVLSGFELSQHLPASAIIVSRERRAYAGTVVTDSADLAGVTTLAKLSVPVEFVDSVFTTRTEALRMLSLARQRKWSTLAVVTSPLHTRRACATFEAVGFRVVCVPSASREFALTRKSTPEDRLRGFRSWLYETFATATYRSRGWIR